jgi:hypothetical protein
MAGEPTSHLRIEKNRHWEDYQSLKKYWSSAAKFISEYIFNGTQTSTDTAAEFKSGTDATIAFLGANDMVYARTEADLAALDGNSIWMDYVSSTGVLYENVETKYDSVTATTTEVPIGCESGTYVDTVASVLGDTITMTNLDMSAGAADTLAGWFVVGCGDATDQEGAYLTILSNTAANPTVITCTTTPNANWANDNVSIQSTVHPYVYRIRRLWTETESPANNYQCICDKDKTNIYGTVDDTNTYGGCGSRYFALSSSYRCFLGHIHLEAPESVGADGDNLEHMLTLTFTPKTVDSDQAAADITITRSFNGTLDWQPCFELQPCTEVTFKIHKVLNQDYVAVGLDYEILEVDLT